MAMRPAAGDLTARVLLFYDIGNARDRLDVKLAHFRQTAVTRDD